MADIDVYLEQILSATYGEEVRSSIYNALRAMNNEVEEAVAAATEAQSSAIASAQAAAASASEASDSVLRVESVGQNMMNQFAMQYAGYRAEIIGYKEDAYGYKEDAEEAADNASQSVTDALNYANEAHAAENIATRAASDISTALSQCSTYALRAEEAANDARDALTEIQEIISGIESFKSTLRYEHFIEDFITDSDGNIVLDSDDSSLAGVVIFAVSDDVEYLLERIETLKELIRRLENEVTFLETNN